MTTPSPLTTAAGWQLTPAPHWPPVPEGWVPPPNWSPDPSWPKPPRGWRVWTPGTPTGTDIAPALTSSDMTWAEPLGAPIEGEARRRTKVEIWIALAVFPLPALITALVLLVRSAVEGTEPSQISRVLPRHDALSSVLGSVLYTTSGAGVLVAAFFLTSGGIRLRDLGVRRDGLGRDLRYAFGIVGAGLGINFVLALIIVASFGKNGIPGSFSAKDQHFPTVFLLQGYVVSIVTATVEEGVINAYLLTRFGQLGWTPRKALWVSMVLRTSYHAYYGVGFLLTVPVGWVLTRSFQRHRRVLRVIAAHAVYDALLFTIAILAS